MLKQETRQMVSQRVRSALNHGGECATSDVAEKLYKKFQALSAIAQDLEGQAAERAWRNADAALIEAAERL